MDAKVVNSDIKRRVEISNNHLYDGQLSISSWDRELSPESIKVAGVPARDIIGEDSLVQDLGAWTGFVVQDDPYRGTGNRRVFLSQLTRSALFISMRELDLSAYLPSRAWREAAIIHEIPSFVFRTMPTLSPIDILDGGRGVIVPRNVLEATCSIPGQAGSVSTAWKNAGTVLKCGATYSCQNRTCPNSMSPNKISSSQLVGNG